jgi:hypothetical protein
METDELRQKLTAELPALFTRRTAEKALGGLLAAGTLANLDSAGTGFPVKVRLGKRVGYERETFISWLLERFGAPKAGSRGGGVKCSRR